MDLINGEKETVGSVLLNFLQSDEPENVIKLATVSKLTQTSLLSVLNLAWMISGHS